MLSPSGFSCKVIRCCLLRRVEKLHVQVQGIKGPVLNMASNNFLALALNPEIQAWQLSTHVSPCCLRRRAACAHWSSAVFQQGHAVCVGSGYLGGGVGKVGWLSLRCSAGST